MKHVVPSWKVSGFFTPSEPACCKCLKRRSKKSGIEIAFRFLEYAFVFDLSAHERCFVGKEFKNEL